MYIPCSLEQRLFYWIGSPFKWGITQPQSLFNILYVGAMNGTGEVNFEWLVNNMPLQLLIDVFGKFLEREN